MRLGWGGSSPKIHGAATITDLRLLILIDGHTLKVIQLIIATLVAIALVACLKSFHMVLSLQEYQPANLFLCAESFILLIIGQTTTYLTVMS